jgi:glycerate kinase
LGTGELILAALDLGVKKIGVGIGGSATNDGGVGMATALGVRFLDRQGDVVRPLGRNLVDIAHIDMSGLDSRLSQVTIEAVCDVDNPLVGEAGAAAVYGPQKGATLKQVRLLEAGLVNLARVIKADLGKDVTGLPGGGAAGGLGAGLYAFLGAALRPGVEVVLDMVNLDEKLENADLVFTGEGQIDFQTVFGKAPAGVGRRAQRKNIPCIALAGSVGENLGDLHEQGISAVFSLCAGPMSLQDAMDDAGGFITRSTQQILRCFLAGTTPQF